MQHVHARLVLSGEELRCFESEAMPIITTRCLVKVSTKIGGNSLGDEAVINEKLYLQASSGILFVDGPACYRLRVRAIYRAAQL